VLAAGVRPEDIANPDYVKAAPILDGIDQFDAPFFGFSPRDASIMDPNTAISSSALGKRWKTPVIHRSISRFHRRLCRFRPKYLSHLQFAHQPKLMESAGSFY